MIKNVLYFLLMICLFASGCHRDNAEKPPSAAEPILAGEHKLWRIPEQPENGMDITASPFIVIGTKKNGVIEVQVKFAWQMNDGTYQLSTLPFDKIRINIDNNAATPTVKFRWRRWRWNNDASGALAALTAQALMEHNVVYAIMTVKESDCFLKIHFLTN